MISPDNKIPNSLLGSIVLPDGEWPFEIYKVAGFDNMWDYNIPDNKTQADRLTEKYT